jgi:hypothetical protein
MRLVTLVTTSDYLVDNAHHCLYAIYYGNEGAVIVAYIVNLLESY